MKLEAVEKVFDHVLVPLPGPEVRCPHAQIEVIDEFHQFPVEENLFLGRGEVLAQLRSHVADGRIDALDASVLGDQLRGCLLPYPGNTGQVVGVVTPQRRVLHILRRADPVPLLHPGLVGDHRVADPTSGVHHLHRPTDQLERITVASDDQHLPVVPHRLL